MKPSIYIIFLIFGILGSIILFQAPIIGIILILLGLFGGAWSYISSYTKNIQSDYLFEAQTHLLAKMGAGNTYSKAVNIELKKTGSSKNAEIMLLKALEVNPNDFDALSMLCTMYVLNLSFLKWINPLHKNDNLQKKLTITKTLINRGISNYPKSHVFHDTLGILYDFENKHTKARKEFYISNKLRNDPYCHLLIATSWQMSGEHGKALLEMEKAHIKGAKGWLFNFYYGRALLTAGKYEEAIKYIKLSIAQRGYKLEPLDLLSSVYISTGNFIKAAKYRALTSLLIIKLNPQMSMKYLFEAHGNLLIGLTCYISKLIWKISRFFTIIRNMHIKISPPFEPEFTSGLSMLKKEHYIFAEKLFRKACIITPNRDEIYSNLSLSLALQGKKQEAIKNINKAISIDPVNETYRWNKKQIENESNLNVRIFKQH